MLLHSRFRTTLAYFRVGLSSGISSFSVLSSSILQFHKAIHNKPDFCVCTQSDYLKSKGEEGKTDKAGVVKEAQDLVDDILEADTNVAG